MVYLLTCHPFSECTSGSAMWNHLTQTQKLLYSETNNLGRSTIWKLKLNKPAGTWLSGCCWLEIPIFFVCWLELLSSKWFDKHGFPWPLLQDSLVLHCKIHYTKLKNASPQRESPIHQCLAFFAQQNGKTKKHFISYFLFCFLERKKNILISNPPSLHHKEHRAKWRDFRKLSS